MINIMFIFLLPLLSLLGFETIYRGEFTSTWYWITHHPNQFFVNYVLFFGIFNACYFLYRKWYLISYSFISIGLFFIALISHTKLKLRGEPLLPWDVTLGKEAANISTHLSGFLSQGFMVFLVIFILALSAAIYFLPKEEHDKFNKITISILSVVLFTSFYYEFVPLGKQFSIRLINWDQKWNYDENGMALGFALNSRALSVDKPNDYNKETIDNIVSSIDKGYSVDSSFKPNIIFVMSEAFWDPLSLDTVTFNKDPIPYFRSLKANHTSGELLVPVYGGGTVNTEFEVLTSLSTQFLPKGMMPYTQYVHQPIHSLANLLSSQGYLSTGIHTYDNWFYRRNKVYENFGFDRFISSEFFNNPQYTGEFISDIDFSNRILDEVKLSDKPDFIYGVSMQAHGPYSIDKNPVNTIKTDSDLSAEATAILESYSQTLHDVDKSLQLLIEGLEEINEPSIVVFFGDHLPMLGDDYLVYKEADYFKDYRDYEDYKKMHTVPFVIWDNFSGEQKELRLSTNALAPVALELAKKEGSTITDFLSNKLHENLSILTREDFQQHEAMTQTDIKHYKLLQYDSLFGHGFALKKKPSIKTTFMHGSELPSISSTNPPAVTAGEVFNAYKNESVLGLNGNHFTSNSQIFINGDALKTDFHNENYLTAILPKQYYEEGGNLIIEVKTTDSMKNVISKSNPFDLKITDK